MSCSLSIGVEAQRAIARWSAGFSRRIRFTRAMSVAQAVRAVEVPVLDLVLLGVADTPRCPARAARARTARTPDRRCRSSAPSVAARTKRVHERGAPAVCRYSVRMSGVFGQSSGRKKSRTGGLRQLGESTP